MKNLIIGGIRSGKSRFAEQALLSLKQAGKVDSLCYIATTEVRDSEMASRVKRHQAERDSAFQTVELGKTAYALPTALAAHDRQQTGILVECMSTWMGQLLTSHEVLDQALAHYYEEREQLLARLQVHQGPLYIVTNEVGCSLVSMNRLGRVFADEMGWLNQALAAQCEQVHQVVAGLPLQLK